MKKTQYILVLALLLLSEFTFSQDFALIYGRITDSIGDPVELVNISISGSSLGTLTNKDGEYRLLVPSGKNLNLVISYIGYKEQEIQLQLGTGEKVEINTNIEPSLTRIEEVIVTDDREKYSPVYRISPKHIKVIPNISGNFESIIKIMPGVTSSNELSSQYSVRGGNFDENLVYVNGIEVYRPFLIRSGQQEGLSFINSNMVSSIKFSSGGFEAKYGDKISSVLDITYKKPIEFEASASASLLGGTAHFADISKNKKFTSNTGLRYKTSKYLLETLSTDAEYNPAFIDFQSFLTYKLSPKFELNFLGSYSHNKYEFIPKSRKTSFGVSNFLISEIYDFRIYYNGQEIDKFETFLGAFSIQYKPNKNVNLQLIASGYSTIEKETFDIQGAYRLDDLQNAVIPESFGDSILNFGYARYWDHARNYLTANVYSINHNGTWYRKNNEFRWGVKFQNEIISDEISEWKMIDSAGYSLPYTNENVNLQNVIRAQNSLNSNRITAFFQDTRSFIINNTSLNVTAGIRSNYWTFNNQLLISPRLSISVKPDWKRNILFYTAWGYYFQSPFYKELINNEGNINPNIKSQKSIHYVIGSDYNCILWNRPFKFTTEIYYKRLHDLIPYKINNVRIQYSAENNASGYATGIDFKLNGEFVENAESWVSLSFLKTEENIINDYYYNSEDERIEPGHYPRPTDQRINFNLFFQDYFPRNPSYKVHLNLVFGSGLPFSTPHKDIYNIIKRTPSYKRVDIGFSKTFNNKKKESVNKEKLNKFKSIWFSAEIFNLFNINNTISYLWVKTTPVGNQNSSALFAVPNYLTSRRLNFRVIAEF